MDYEVSTIKVLSIISVYVIYLFTVYYLHINQNMYPLLILNGIASLIAMCIMIKLYYSLKDYNSRWRNINHEI